MFGMEPSLGPLLASFLLVFTTLVLFLWHSSRKQSYWKKLDIPYATPIPVLGSLWETFNQPLHEVEQNRYKKYGRLYGHYEGNKPLISVGEPEILRKILVKDFQTFTGRRSFVTGDKIVDKMVSLVQGEDWKRIRTIITPTFTTGKIKKMMNIFKECSQALVQNFKLASEKGEPVDVKRVYGAFTMDIIASSAFSTKIDSHNDPNNEFVKTAREMFSRNISWRFIVFVLCPGLVKLLRISVFPPKGRNFFAKVVMQIIEERRRTGQKGNDFLQLLLDTAEEVNEEGKSDLNEKDDLLENYGEEENDHIFKQTALTKKTLSHDEIIAQCVIFFLAGYDTTASTLSFASYLLALNTDIQEKLIQELDDAMRENNGELTYDAVQNMKYLDNVISETLRMYPPAARLERVAEETYNLGDTGLTLSKDMLVTIPVYAMHRDEEFFPEPEKFDPDRFTAEERAKRNQYSYLPFGAGPRNCVGMRFALMEIKVCLAYVLSNFRIKRCSQTKVPPVYYIGQALLQPKEIKLYFEKRNDVGKMQ